MPSAIAQEQLFSLSTHAWSEPDSVAHTIAERHAIRLLDRPIGTVIYF